MFRSLAALSEECCTKKHFDVLIGQLEASDADSAGVVSWHGRLSVCQIQTLASAFKTSSATCISITGSELGDSGAQLIANCLWHNDRVEKLCLAGNNISARGVEALAEALLNANLTITSLDLTGNPGEADAPFAMNIIAFCLERNQLRTCKTVPHGSTEEANVVKLQARLGNTDNSCHMINCQQESQTLQTTSWKTGLEQLIKQQLVEEHQHQGTQPWAGHALVEKCQEALQQARVDSEMLLHLSNCEVVQELQYRLLCIETVLSQALAAVGTEDCLAHVQEGCIVQLLCSLAAKLAAQSVSPSPDSDTETFPQSDLQEHAHDLEGSDAKQRRQATDSAYDSAEEDCVSSMCSKATCSTATQTDIALQLDSHSQQCSKLQQTQQQQQSKQQATHSVLHVANYAKPDMLPHTVLRKRSVRFITNKHRFL